MTSDKFMIEGRRSSDTMGGEYRYSSTVIPGIIKVVDILSILGAGTITCVLIVDPDFQRFDYYFFAIVFIAFVTFLLNSSARLYSVDAIMRPISKSDLVIVSVVSAFLFFLTIAFSLKVSEEYSRVWVYSFFGGSILTLSINRVLASVLLGHLSRRRIVGRSLLVLGTGPQAEQFLTQLSEIKPYFTNVLGVFSPQEEPVPSEFAGFPVLGTEDELLDFVRTHRVDDVVVAMPWQDDSGLSRTVEALKELPINVYISMDLAGYQLKFRPVFSQFSQLPLFEIVRRPISGWSFLLKLLEDYVIASLILIVLSPLMLLIAAAIKLDSPGPIFFMQKRLGFNNETFEIYKFRSMVHRDDPEVDLRQASKNDPRITRVGRIIRRTSLDELPQLLNVLNGSMSLVGPRPHALRHNEEYGRQIRGYFARHNVKPGITGWAQVNGLRGETETLSKMESRVAHDVYYAENWSLLFDLRILVMTVIVVLFQKTAY